jgi:hypothetical protein
MRSADAPPDALRPSVTMGSADPTFGTDGVVLIARGDTDTANGFLLQPSGRILFDVETVAGSVYSGTLTAFTPDGVVDPTFGTNGSCRS